MSWIQAAPAFLVTGLLLFLPGLAVVSAGGARGLSRWASAVPVTFSIAGVSAIALELLSIPFTWLSFGATTLLLTGGVGAVRWFLLRRRSVPVLSFAAQPQPRPAHFSPQVMAAATVLALITAAGLIGARLLTSIRTPETIAQLFDNVFHLNATAIIHESGVGSSLTLGNLTPDSHAFYPAAFHDIAAIVMGLGVGDVAVTLNAVSILMSAVVWPLSLVYLMTRLFGNRVDVVIMTCVLASAFAAFPYRLFSFGVLYPFLAGLTMLPVLTALIVEFFGATRIRPVPLWSAVWMLLAVAPGIALTHPSVVVASLVFAAPFVLARVITVARQRHESVHAKPLLILGALYLLGTIITFIVIRPPLSSAPWTPFQNYREAIGSIVTASPGTAAVAWVLVPLVLAGIIAAARRPAQLWPTAALFVIGAVMYFASAATDNSTMRDLLSGVWYRDPERLAALFVIASLPLMLTGALAITHWIRVILRRRRGADHRLLAVAVVAVLVVLGGLRGPLPQGQQWMSESFGNAGVFSLLDPDERLLLEQVDVHVPEDGVVVGNPRTGASLSPAFANRATLAPHIYGERTSDEQYLLEHWDEAGEDPLVCPIIQRLSAFWALDFGSKDVQGVKIAPLPGTDLANRDETTDITLLAQVGSAALYEATACNPPAN